MRCAALNSWRALWTCLGTIPKGQRRNSPKTTPTADFDHTNVLNAPCSNVTGCSGATTAKACGACQSPARIRLACAGQQLRNYTGQDGTPVTFSLPVDMATLKAEHFRWRYADGSTRAVGCALPRGAGESEAASALAPLFLFVVVVET